MSAGVLAEVGSLQTTLDSKMPGMRVECTRISPVPVFLDQMLYQLDYGLVYGLHTNVGLR